MRSLLYCFTLLFPWSLRRRLLGLIFGYSLHPTSRIGVAWILPKKLTMGPYSRIGTLSVCKGLSLVELGENASIGRLNWITGVPAGNARHFVEQTDRRPELIMGKNSAITNRHIIDCTSSVSIGEFSTFGGFRSQVLTHGIDIESCRQRSAPVRVGAFCFVGTDCVLLSGSSLPDYSVLGAKSLLNKQYTETFCLYAGTPARPVKSLSKENEYFKRTVGFVA